MDGSVVVSAARERSSVIEEILIGVVAGHRRALT